jgi:hypothetical protein
MPANVPGFRSLYFDDARAEVGEAQRSGGAGKELAEIDD